MNTCIIIFLTLVMYQEGVSQNLHFRDGFVFEQFHTPHEGPNNQVNTFLEDSQGFIWYSTNNGLNVFDGNNIKAYKNYLNEGNNFRGKWIPDVFEDNYGNIISSAGTKGINVLNRKTGIFTNIQDSLFTNLSSKLIISTVQNSSGLYFAVTEKDLIQFTLDKSFRISSIESTPLSLKNSNKIKRLLAYKDEVLIVTRHYIKQFNSASKKINLLNDTIKKCLYKNDRLWVLTKNKIGVLQKDFKTINWISYNLNNTENNYLDFDIDSNKTLWIGTKTGVTQISLDENLKPISSKNIDVFYSKMVRKVYIDKSNNLYLNVGLRDGVFVLNHNQNDYNYVNLPEESKNEYLYSFSEDKNGLLWCAGFNGVQAYNPKTKSFFTFNNGSFKALRDLQITDIIEDGLGTLWVGTEDGIAKFNEQDRTFSFYGRDLKSKGTFTHHLRVDQNNNKWFVIGDGLGKIDHENEKVSFFPTGYSSSMHIDAKNTLWISLDKNGLYGADISLEQPKMVFEETEIFKNIKTHGIKVDQQNRLWLSGNNGIYVFDKNTRKVVKHINKDNLLKNESLHEIVPENNGNFWVKQTNSPSVFINSQTFEVIDYSPRWMRLNGHKQEFSGPQFIDKSGKIFTDGRGGFWVYNPNDLTISLKPPKIVITDLKVNGTSKFSNFLGTTNLNLDNLTHEENAFEINFKTIQPNPSFQTQYAYRLLGSSNEWNYSKELTHLNFSTLQPNSYKLEVKTTNNGNLWSKPKAIALFTIASPWWKTTLAYIIYTLLFIALIYAFYRVQLNRKLAVSEANQLKQLDDFKNKFYQNITHEFRTPLTVIIGMAESIESQASKMIKRNAQQLLSLVNELLEIGKIESNSANLELSTKDIVAFTKYCMESLESLAKQKDIKLKFDANPESILMEFDIDKVQLVLNNLISNAIKFTPNNGSVELSVIAKNEMVEIQVVDSGTGIADENLEKVFDRYFQEKTNKSSSGTGLGLALSKELVQLMNGTLQAYNNEDSGACFVVSLPLAKNTISLAQNQDHNTSYKVESTFENEENIILVIEDNEDVLTYISSVLKPFYKVYSAPNGKLGFEKAIELIPDLIISDLMMPVMDGYESCHLIKSDFRTNHIPVIMLTAKVDHNSKISGLKLGADVYLGKPFNSEELLTHINNLIAIRENLKKKYSERQDNGDVQAPKISNEFLNKISGVLLNNISDDAFGINEICREIGVSRTQLHRKLKALTGLSTSIFIRGIRLNEAYKLVKESELSVSEIAYSVGYNDPNYFTKLFTEKFGTPPTKLIK